MFDVNAWVADLTAKLEDTFPDKLLFVGLQGSYRRGEADCRSDIDVVVILDTLSLLDLVQYKSILSTMPQSDKSCGFISGRQELINWPKHELFQFVHDTLPVRGQIDGLIPAFTRDDIIESAKISASGLYHACCHAFVHERLNLETVKKFFKSAFFLLQTLYHLRHDVYIDTKKALEPLLAGNEALILRIAMNWDDYKLKITAEPDYYYDLLIKWCAGILKEPFEDLS
ncbi:MAG: nucleotidyltransferase domain-containing protein [Oscillospiraceae bacterium]|jgi:hypothetical protein|nr:nucleotidyltransferase domain-containing protein [Oscillospiraceae bacterium]